METILLRLLSVWAVIAGLSMGIVPWFTEGIPHGTEWVACGFIESAATALITLGAYVWAEARR